MQKRSSQKIICILARKHQPAHELLLSMNAENCSDYEACNAATDSKDHCQTPVDICVQRRFALFPT